MVIQPIGNRYLVKQDKKELKANLIVNDDETLRRPTGTIIEVGDGKDVGASRLVKGDRICFNELSGERVVLDGEEYLLIRLEDVLAKFM